ncbi:hypothetical protein D8881_05485 [Streptococcus sanguinis]|uniref:Uncharacterized protein n=1 Tax=Streptococcus sanguinis TaxID=1305 RepID=A0ABD7JMN7_STRSA|nr:hypothetical protein D8881_05485 [Streptococcus sanguinis]
MSMFIKDRVKEVPLGVAAKLSLLKIKKQELSALKGLSYRRADYPG